MSVNKEYPTAPTAPKVQMTVTIPSNIVVEVPTTLIA
jgi:proline-rich tail region repeat protein